MDTRQLDAKAVLPGNYAAVFNRMSPEEKAIPDSMGFYFVRAEYDRQGDKTFILLSRTPPEES